jgi:hypothetical protein
MAANWVYWFANDPVDSVMKRKNISQSFFPPILFFKKRYVPIATTETEQTNASWVNLLLGEPTPAFLWMLMTNARHELP